jgi:hypothetical protein
MTNRIVALTAFVLSALSFGATARAVEDEEKFVLTGYISTQMGIFLDPEKSDSEWWNFSDKTYDPETKTLKDFQWSKEQPLLEDGRPNSKFREFPTRHGDKFLTPSMLRSTLMLEADWNPWDDVNVHAIFRGVRALKVDADTDAQPPVPGAVSDNQAWVRDHFYNENDLREIYVSASVTDWWTLRLGRQQVSWGEIGQYRLLDVVNPQNTTWHFGSLESFEDTRIPLYMLNTTFDFAAIESSLDVVWIPMLDKSSNLVNTPLTFPGAWGLPLAPVQDDKGVAKDKVARKLFEYPDNRLEDSRVGARWKGTLFEGFLNYTLVYFYGHQMTPPIPKYYISRAPLPYIDAHGDKQLDPDEGTDVYLYFPRQHTAGFSTEFALDNPIGAAIRVEAAFEPWRVFPVNSLETSVLQTEREAMGLEAVEKLDPKDHRKPYAGDGEQAAKTYFRQREKNVVNYAVQVMRPTMMRFLNPTQNVMVVLQWMHSVVLDYSDADRLIDIPGYDSSKTREHDMKIICAMFTNYLNGMLVPKLTVIYALPKDAIISAGLGMVFGNHWRLNLTGNVFMGENPYRGVGLFRDRDEVNLTVLYQF